MKCVTGLGAYPALLTRMYHSTSRRTWRGV